MARRIYVRVMVEIDEAGSVKPVRVFWEDGRVFDVERVMEVHFAAAERAGGAGMCYSCRVMGRSTRLYEDEGRWFVEARDRPGSEWRMA